LSNQIDRVSFDYKFLSNQRNYRSYTSRNNHSSSASSTAVTSAAPVPMELDSIQASTSAGDSRRRSSSSNPNHKPLTQSQKQYLMTHDGCFYCRKANAGHRARNCPEKLKAN